MCCSVELHRLANHEWAAGLDKYFREKARQEGVFMPKKRDVAR